MTDPIADLLTRLRNASLVRQPEVILPASKVKLAIARLLQEQGYLDGVELDASGHGELRLRLRYGQGGQPALTHLRRVSKPGQKIYVTRDRLPRVQSGYGLAILSTSRGIMTDRQARKEGVGGEWMCEIW